MTSPTESPSYTVSLHGTNDKFECAEGETILDAAERAGLALPYSCRKGVCATCAADLRHGRVQVRGGTFADGPTPEVLLCGARPCSDVEIVPAEVRYREILTRRTLEAEVASIEFLQRDVVELRLRFPVGRRVPFEPGQYLRVLFDGESRNYSMANPPQNCDGVVIHVRRIPGGHFSDHYLRKLVVGSMLPVELPFGQMTPAGDARPLLMAVTGTGVSAALSVIADQIRRADDRPLYLYWGARRQGDHYCAERLARWDTVHPWFRFTPVVSSPDPGWGGANGWVQDVALEEHPSLAGYQVVACGNPAMVEAARRAFVDRGKLEKESFYADPFVFTGAYAT